VPDQRWVPAFAATIIAMMAIQMSSRGFSPLLPAIQKDFGLSYSQSIAVSVRAGFLAKRVGEKIALSLGLLGVALGLLLLSQAPSYKRRAGGLRGLLLGYRVAFRSTAMGILGAMASLASSSGEASFHAHGPSMPTGSAFRTPVVWSMVLLGLINMGGFSATFFVPSAVRSTFH
jgi:fucose permease